MEVESSRLARVRDSRSRAGSLRAFLRRAFFRLHLDATRSSAARSSAFIFTPSRSLYWSCTSSPLFHTNSFTVARLIFGSNTSPLHEISTSRSGATSGDVSRLSLEMTYTQTFRIPSTRGAVAFPWLVRVGASWRRGG